MSILIQEIQVLMTEIQEYSKVVVSSPHGLLSFGNDTSDNWTEFWIALRTKHFFLKCKFALENRICWTSQPENIGRLNWAYDDGS